MKHVLLLTILFFNEAVQLVFPSIVFVLSV